MTANKENLCHNDRSDRLPISVIIVNHNAGALLTSCVDTVLEQVQEVIIVDNASTDTSLAELETRFPSESRLKQIHTGINLGFSAGCNIGLNTATAPYILFLNPDCLLKKDSIKRLHQVIDSDPHIGMVGGRLINPDGTEQGGGRRAFPTPWRSFVRAFGLYRLEKYWPQLFFDFHLHQQPLPQIPIPVEAISGALMLVRREAIESVGNWDEGYFLHCEDLDWCMRFRQEDWQVLFVPDAPVMHYRGTCSQARPFFVAWHKHKGMLRFYKKFFREKYSGILMGLVTLGIGLRFSAVVMLHAAKQLSQWLNNKNA